MFCVSSYSILVTEFSKFFVLLFNIFHFCYCFLLQYATRGHLLVHWSIFNISSPRHCIRWAFLFTIRETSSAVVTRSTHYAVKFLPVNLSNHDGSKVGTRFLLLLKAEIHHDLQFSGYWGFFLEGSRSKSFTFIFKEHCECMELYSHFSTLFYFVERSRTVVLSFLDKSWQTLRQELDSSKAHRKWKWSRSDAKKQSTSKNTKAYFPSPVASKANGLLFSVFWETKRSSSTLRRKRNNSRSTRKEGKAQYTRLLCFHYHRRHALFLANQSTCSGHRAAG
jgi:hypothetical protein